MESGDTSVKIRCAACGYENENVARCAQCDNLCLTKPMAVISYFMFFVQSSQTFVNPSAITKTNSGMVAIADVNRHSIFVFDVTGRPHLMFGIPGKGHGKMLHPISVKSCPHSGNFVIAERDPVHQLQVYSSVGKYIKRFGRENIKYPRAITVDRHGLIFVVESKIMRISIFGQYGGLIEQFCKPTLLRCPMDICVNTVGEMFVVDKFLHYVLVLDYYGNVLRTICDDGILSCPISICINDADELVITNDQGSIYLAVYTQDGRFLRSYTNYLRINQPKGAALFPNNSICLATETGMFVYRLRG